MNFTKCFYITNDSAVVYCYHNKKCDYIINKRVFTIHSKMGYYSL